MRNIGFVLTDRPMVKSHVKTYTRQDGTVVKEHDDNRTKKASENNSDGREPSLNANSRGLLDAANGRQGKSETGDGDSDDFKSIAASLDEGDYKSAGATLQHMDTEPRDEALSYIHPSHWEKLGFKVLDIKRSIAEYERKFGGSGTSDAADPEPVSDDVSHDSLKKHPMFSESDHKYFKDKGYTPSEIKAIWDRDHAAGHDPVVHKEVPDVVGVVGGKPSKGELDTHNHVEDKRGSDKAPMRKAFLFTPSQAMFEFLVKSQVRGYTKKDGTFVKPHSDKRTKKAGESKGDGDTEKQPIQEATHDETTAAVRKLKAGNLLGEVLSKYLDVTSDREGESSTCFTSVWENKQFDTWLKRQYYFKDRKTVVSFGKGSFCADISGTVVDGKVDVTTFDNYAAVSTISLLASLNTTDLKQAYDDDYARHMAAAENTTPLGMQRLSGSRGSLGPRN